MWYLVLECVVARLMAHTAPPVKPELRENVLVSVPLQFYCDLMFAKVHNELTLAALRAPRLKAIVRLEAIPEQVFSCIIDQIERKEIQITPSGISKVQVFSPQELDIFLGVGWDKRSILLGDEMTRQVLVYGDSICLTYRPSKYLLTLSFKLGCKNAAGNYQWGCI